MSSPNSTRCYIGCLRQRSHEELVEYDEAFHHVVAAAAGNATLASMLNGVSSRTTRGRVWRGVHRGRGDRSNDLRARGDPRRAACPRSAAGRSRRLAARVDDGALVRQPGQRTRDRRPTRRRRQPGNWAAKRAEIGPPAAQNGKWTAGRPERGVDRHSRRGDEPRTGKRRPRLGELATAIAGSVRPGRLDSHSAPIAPTMSATTTSAHFFDDSPTASSIASLMIPPVSGMSFLPGYSTLNSLAPGGGRSGARRQIDLERRERTPRCGRSDGRPPTTRRG